MSGFRGSEAPPAAQHIDDEGKDQATGEGPNDGELQLAEPERKGFRPLLPASDSGSSVGTDDCDAYGNRTASAGRAGEELNQCSARNRNHEQQGHLDGANGLSFGRDRFAAARVEN